MSQSVLTRALVSETRGNNSRTRRVAWEARDEFVFIFESRLERSETAIFAATNIGVLLATDSSAVSLEIRDKVGERR